MFNKALENLEKGRSIVHCITNYVTVNDVANIILASGASPIMADAIEEVSDITSICSALALNIGTLNNRTIESMIKAGKTANELNKPVVFDPVGIGASKLRTKTVLKLLEEIKFSVIRGNASEIKAILMGSKTSSGVDVSIEDSINENNLDVYINIAKKLSKDYNSVVVITGPIDIITDGKQTYIIKNGHPIMEKVTGTGCMLTGLIGGFIGANPDDILESTTLAVAAMGLSGEIANDKVVENDLGTGSFRTFLIDNISKFDIGILNGGIKIENR